MDINILKLIFSSMFYSFTPLFEKNILNTLTKDVYILIKYTFRFISIIFLNIVKNKNISVMEHIIKIKEVFLWLVGLTVISLGSQYIYFDILKELDLSIIEPIGSVIINICSILIGAFFLKEAITIKKILGIIIGAISIFLLT